jgi:predicted RNA-binding protein with PUA-like domain
MNLWLFKSDPDDYGFPHLERDRKTTWDGVRNPQALGYLRQVKTGDQILIYHTGEEKAVVGLAEAVKPAYPDPKGADDKLVVVDIRAKGRLKQPVPLAKIKEDKSFADLHLVRMSRLSVMPVSQAHWDKLLKMAAM